MELIVHIGARKTGTTTIQRVLKGNIKVLAEQGFFISDRFNDEADNIFADAFLGKQESMPDCEQWLEDLKSAKENGCTRAIISSESLTDLRLNEIKKFYDFFEPHVSVIKVVLYIRRQDIVATSHYSTGLRGGGTGNQLMSMGMGKRGIRGFRFKKIADDWSEVCGRDAMNIRVFPDPRPENWDALSDFISIIPLTDPNKIEIRRSDYNSRLSAKQASYLLAFNLKLGVEAKKRAPSLQRRFLASFPDISEGQRVPAPMRSVAESFYKQFKDGNESLRKAYLPHLKAPLFQEDFTNYPVDAENLESYFNEEDFEERYMAFTQENEY